MANGYHGFIAGEKPPATTLNDYISKQVLMKFASAAARTSALTGLFRAGIATILDDLRTIGINTGATDAWSTVGPVHGALATWTPTWTQTATITKTVTDATTSRVGREITAYFQLNATSAGTNTGTILWGLPVPAKNSIGLIGSVQVLNASTGNYTAGGAFLTSSTTFGLYSSGGAVTTILNGGEAVASGDIAYATIVYEAASDA